MRIINLSNLNKVLLLLVVILVSGCAAFRTQDFNAENVPKAPDYNLEHHWAVLPNKYTKDFAKYSHEDIDTLAVDVFYIYPTLITEKNDERWNVPINDKDQQEKVLYKAVLMQASAFANVGKVYVPYYRQAHIRSYPLIEKGGRQAQEVAYRDVRDAFDLYLHKYNRGRPIIIAGHSQGTTHALRLLSDFFDNKTLQDQLVAAYIPGIRVSADHFKTIHPMTRPEQTGGFVSWNTFKKGHFPKKDKNWYRGSVTTNPVTWDDTQRTSLSQHKGFLYTNGKIYSQALTVEITDGMVWSSNPKFPMRFFMSWLKNYHAGDINLFWQDIRENVELRVNTYLRNQ